MPKKFMQEVYFGKKLSSDFIIERPLFLIYLILLKIELTDLYQKLQNILMIYKRKEIPLHLY